MIGTVGAESAPMEQPVLLVVDDSKENRTMLARRLAREGYQVLPAESGAQALEILELQRVTLVLLDLRMPDMDGFEVLDEIRKVKDDRELPVFMVSANNDQPTKVAAMKRGANDFLCKPVEYEFLLARLQQQLKHQTTAPGRVDISQLQVGDCLAHYRLDRLLGEGGMGRVYQAYDQKLLRHVALKIMQGAFSPESQQRFLTEARAVARVSHPNVVTIYEIGDTPCSYLTMELVEGVELEAFAGGRALEPELACRLAIQIADALQAVHERGILHRDLKPANVMVCQERVKVMDFGLAKIVESNEKLTRSGEVWGTPQFMSPEHFDPARGDVDQHSDQFALAGILYQMLTGAPPFRSSGLSALMYEVLSKNPRHPCERFPNVPRPLGDICMRGLAKDKKERFASAGQMAQALRQLSW